VDPLDPKHLVMAFMDYNLNPPSGTYEGYNPATHTYTGYNGESVTYAGIGVEVSHDGGLNWSVESPVQLPAADSMAAGNPVVKFDNQGHFYVTFMAATFLGTDSVTGNPLLPGVIYDNSNTTLGNGQTVSERAFGMRANNGVFVAEGADGGTSTISWDQVAPVAANAYNGTTEVPFETLPDIAIDTNHTVTAPDGTQVNPMYVTWTRFYPLGQFPEVPGPNNAGSDAMIAVSRDGGHAWTTEFQADPFLANVQVSAVWDPNVGGLLPSPTEGRGASGGPSHVSVGPDGTVYVSEYDGGYFAVFHSTDGSATFVSPNPNTANNDGYVLFPPSIQTPLGFLYGGGAVPDTLRTLSSMEIAADPAQPGTIFALQTIEVLNSTGSQVIDSGDVYFAHSTDDGETWTTTFTLGTNPDASVLNDDNGGQSPTGVPTDVLSGHALPQLSVDAQGDVSVIWYDTRRDPNGDLLDVYGTTSTDGGQTFTANYRVTTQNFNPNVPGPSLGAPDPALGAPLSYFGDRIGLASAGGTVYAAWTDTLNGSQNISFASYPVSPAPLPFDDRYGPNYTPLTATNLGVISAPLVESRLALGDSTDEWFQVTAGATGTFTVSVSAPAAGNLLQLHVFNADGTTQPANVLVTPITDQNGAVVGEQVSFDGQSGDTYLIDVSGGIVPSYTLVLESLTEDFGTSVQGAGSGQITFNFNTGFDTTDVYRLQAAVGGSLAVTLNETGGGSDLTLQVLGADGVTVLASGPQVNLPINQGEVVLIEVTGKNPSPTDAFNFTLAFTNLDQYETPQPGTLFFPTGGSPNGLAAADFNGDKVPDLVVTSNLINDSADVLLGNGDGTFQAERQFALGVGPQTENQAAKTIRQPVVADLTGNGIDDLIVPNYDSGDVSVLLGNGDGTFQPQRRYDATPHPISVVVGDFNGDGIPDIAVLGLDASGRPELAILFGRGDGTFQPPVVSPLDSTVLGETPNTLLDLGNVSGNGHDALVVVGASNFQVLDTNGDGTVTVQGTYAVGETTETAQLADVNGDGKLDLLVGGAGTGSIYVFLGNGDGTFQTPLKLTTLIPGPGDNVLIEGIAVANFGSEFGATGNPDIVVTAASRTGAFPDQVLLLPGLVDNQGQFAGFGPARSLATVEQASQVVVGDFSGHGTLDIATADGNGVLLVYGTPPDIAANTTPQTARDLGTVLHSVSQPQAIVAGYEDAYFSLTVPTEVVAGAGPEVLDFAADFAAVQGAGLQMEVLDATGTVVLGSGSRFQIVANQGEKLRVRVFGLPVGNGLAQGAGVYTLDIDVLPQVVSIQAESLLPGVGNLPGGPINSLVITLQGDALDPATAEDPTNYTVELIGPGGNNQVIPLATSTQPVLYDEQADAQVASGLVYPTAVRQTITLLFDQPLPVGSYQIDLSPAIQTAPFSLGESALLGLGASNGHPLVSVSGTTIIDGSEHFAFDLVQPAGPLGSFQAFSDGTSFLSQLQSDLSALLDQMLASQSNDATITSAMIQQILARFEPVLGPPGQRPSFLVLWLDPVAIDLADAQGNRVVFDAQNNQVKSDLAKTYVEVGGNVELLVVANAAGTFALNVADVPPTARGGAVVIGDKGTQTVGLTEGLQAGQDQFTFNFGESTLAAASPSSATVATSTTSLAALLLVGLSPGNEFGTGQTTTGLFASGLGAAEFGTGLANTTGSAPALSGGGGGGNDGGPSFVFWPYVPLVVDNLRDYANRLTGLIDPPLRDFTSALNSVWGALGGKDGLLPQVSVGAMTSDLIDMLLEAGLEVYQKVDPSVGPNRPGPMAPLFKRRPQRKAQTPANPPKAGAALPPPVPIPPADESGADEVLAPLSPLAPAAAPAFDADFTDRARGVLAAAVFAAGAWQGIWNAPSVARVVRRRRPRPDVLE